MKQLIKNLTPPILLNFLKKIKSMKYGWNGNYKIWKEAQLASTGYDNNEILKKVRNSILKVKNNEIAYERDSVLFDKIQYSWPLLAGLLFASTKSKGKFGVLDFGGSLGSTYFQNKKFLDELPNISWSIVEQNHFVDIGKKDFEDTRLKFFYEIEECIKEEQPNILVLSSVLQYIEKPYKLLNDLLKYNFDFIIIDRTPFNYLENDEIKLQTVSPKIYNASYPCWFFTETKFLKYFENNGYKIIETFDALDGKTNKYTFKGFILEKKC